MNEMPKRNPIQFFEGFTFQKTKKKGRTTVVNFNFGTRVNRKRYGFSSYEKTVIGGGKRTYSKTIDLNDEQNPSKVASKLLNIRRVKK